MIIKPDAVQKRMIGNIINRIEENGFLIEQLKMITMTQKFAEEFYSMHKDKDFFQGLVEFMTSGPSVMLILKKENAIKDLRKLVGNTDSRKAEVGTLRNEFGTDNRQNAIHASDSIESSQREIDFFYRC